MTDSIHDGDQLRHALRTMPRENLLIIAERAAKKLSSESLHAVFRDFIALHPDFIFDAMTESALLDQAKTFYKAAMAGHYYEQIDVNNRGMQALSYGTQAFVAEFDRLLNHCVASVELQPSLIGRMVFDTLWALLRHIDTGADDILFFADEGGIVDVFADWQRVLPSYFKCLAISETKDTYFLAVDSVVNDFARHDRERLLTVAREILATCH